MLGPQNRTLTIARWPYSYWQQLSKNLVEIHGQHAHLKLLQPEEQRSLLDAFANTSALASDLASLHQKWHTTNDKINNQRKDQQQFAERTELLQFQLNELQQLDLEHFNYEKINTEHARLANIEQILSNGFRNNSITIWKRDSNQPLLLSTNH